MEIFTRRLRQSLLPRTFVRHTHPSFSDSKQTISGHEKIKKTRKELKGTGAEQKRIENMKRNDRGWLV